MNLHEGNPTAIAVPGLPQAALEAGIKSDLSASLSQEEDAEELNYNPIPPKKTKTISVRYRIRGRGQPLPYAVDEGDGE